MLYRSRKVVNVSGYKLHNVLYQNKRTIVYSGYRETDRFEIVLKTIAGEYPTLDQIGNIYKEYKILEGIDSPNIVKVLSLFEFNAKPYIVMEAIAGESIANVLENRNLSTREFLELAIAITDGIKSIHEKNIIHKDININNILWDDVNHVCKIIDFSLATDLAQESLSMVSVNQLEGNLYYISPEQTGRMNAVVDYRTDYYSLGITLYKMATGVLPFSSDNPPELVHCHIAKLPVPPHEINKSIPRVVSDIIMKLISKNPEDRYQSMGGLKYDLEKCLATLSEGDIKYFEIARYDISNKFHLPNILYGREKEVAFLWESFQRCSRGSREIVFLSGRSGIGKTSIVSEIHKSVVENNGFFIRGKYDHHDTSIPYSGIIHAFEELINQVLTFSEEKLEIWRNQMNMALGNNGQIIVDILPVVEQLIGEQPPLNYLPPVESQNRFNIVFKNFVRVFANELCPLMIFLDDLQWADQASLDLISVLLLDVDLNYLLFVGAFRDDETDDNHILSLMMDQMKKEKVPLTEVKIEPLSKVQISQMISGALAKSEKEVDQLAELVHAKTKGNPFFIKEFLKTLYRTNLIQYVEDRNDFSKSGWRWDVLRIRQENITDNVIELMVGKFKNLSKDTIEILKVACCLGIRFDLATLGRILNRTEFQIVGDLKEAINEGMLLKEKTKIAFVHNKVMEATYSLLSEENKKDIHYRIGREYLREFNDDDPKGNPFQIAHQWNMVKECLSREEQEQLLDINYMAGIRAKASAAYQDAAIFLQNGAELIPSSLWTSNYAFTFQFFKAWSEAEYLARNFDKAEELFKDILLRAKDILDKQKIYAIMIRHYITQMKSDQALEIGRTTLRQLGIPLPQKPGKIYILKEILKSKILLRKINVKSLIDLPDMQDPKIKAGVEILGICITPALISSPDYVPIIILKVFNLSLIHGIAPMSPFAITMYGLILAGPLGDIKKGIEFGEQGVSLLSKRQCSIARPSTLFSYVTTLLHLKVSFRERLDYSRRAMQVCLEEGNFEYYGYFLGEPPLARIYMGENLNLVGEEFRKNQIKSRQLKQPLTDIYNDIFYQLVENLTGKSENKLILNGDQFHAEKTISLLKERNDKAGQAFIQIMQIILYYLFDDHRSGLKLAMECEKNIDSLLGLPSIQIFYFFYAMLLSSEIIESGKRKKKYLSRLKKIEQKYEKWSDACPDNYLNKYQLIRAEISRAEKRSPDETVRLYLNAVGSGTEYNLTHEVAIANERIAKYYLSRDLQALAKIFMTNAYYGYMKWGCTPKMDDLKQTYPHLISMEALGYDQKPGSANFYNGSEHSSNYSSSSLDLASILKISRAISQEIKLDELLKTMLKVSIENAGAQTGSFFLYRDDRLFHVAIGFIDKPSKLTRWVEVDRSEGYAKSVIRYVDRTEKSLVIKNATVDTRFNQELHIKENKVKSILCIPIFNLGTPLGILYLENNIVPDCFSPDRIELLQLLSGHIAISLNNAVLYENLDHKVKERTKELEIERNKLKEKNTAMERDITLARKIQFNLIPQKITHKFISHLYKPMEALGGDFFDIITFENTDKIGIFMSDVSGHGLTAAFNTSMIKTIILESGDRAMDPANLISHMNDLFYNLAGGNFITIFYGVYDPKKRTLLYSNAGHNFPYVVFENRVTYLTGGKSTAIGVLLNKRLQKMDKMFYNSKETLPVGGKLFIYTDGLTEAMPAGGSEFFEGPELESSIIKNSHLSAEKFTKSLYAELIKFRGNDMFDDDVCFLCMDIK